MYMCVNHIGVGCVTVNTYISTEALEKIDDIFPMEIRHDKLSSINWDGFTGAYILIIDQLGFIKSVVLLYAKNDR